MKRKLLLFFCSQFLSVMLFAQEGAVRSISEGVDQIIIELSKDEYENPDKMNQVIASYSSVEGVLKVEQLRTNTVCVDYTRSKFNGPGIFLGLAKELDYHFVQLITE